MRYKISRMSFAQTVFIYALGKLASLLKVSFAVGSFSIFFSLSNCVFPLGGAFGGFFGAAGLLGLSSVLLVFKKSVSLSYIAYSGIPTFCAGLYWQSGRSYRAIVPLACMALFWMHPTGFFAAPYALFWVIPFVIAFKKDSVFLNALGSTFTAHAVGSVLWLYATNMPAARWYQLLPNVPLERLLFALGLTIMHGALTFLFAKMKLWSKARIELIQY